MTATPRTRRLRRATAPARRTLDQMHQVRALMHPLRLRLLEVFALGRSTTKQAAERLGEPPTRLYHHVYALERAGLLRLTETRPNRGTVEKYFEVTARRFDVAPGLLGSGGAGQTGQRVTELVGRLIEDFRQDVTAGLPRAETLPEDLKPMLARMVVLADEAGIRSIRRELVEFLRRRTEGKKHRRVAGDLQRYTLTLAFMPTDSDAHVRAKPVKPRRRKLEG